MKNQYFLSFADPVPLAEVEDIFNVEEYPVEILEIFSHSFLLRSDLAYSKVKHALEFYYTEEHSPRPYVIMKLKEGSAEAIVLPAKD